jgi:serine/threonine-protein kinase
MTVFTSAGARDLLETLRGSKVLRPGALKLCSNFIDTHPAASPEQLMKFALEKKLLTRFQADHLQADGTHVLKLPPFVLLDSIGAAGAGQVYRARGEDDDKLYVIKILARGTRAGTPRVTQTLNRFAAFRGPAVLPITNVGIVSERTYLVWPEPAEGQTLEQLIHARGKLPAKQVVHYAIQAARALNACHKKGLVHGLLKAGDLHIDVDHEVTIKDIGMGYLLTLAADDSTLDTMTSLGQLASGLDWASPESLMDQRDRTPLGDQYSLGCILYQALSGQVPFPVVSKVRKMMAHQTKEPQPIAEAAPGVPSKLVAIVERLMKKAPAERFADMAEVEAALQALLAKPVATRMLGGEAAQKLRQAAAAAVADKARRGKAQRDEQNSDDGSDQDEDGDDCINWVAWAAPLLAGLAACAVGWLLLA